MPRQYPNPTQLSLAFIAAILLALAGCATAPPIATVSNPPTETPRPPLRLKDRPVVGLALGGGAARGFAHVGVLNTLDKHGIPIDLIVGTSAGSVAGSLYAAGIRGEALKEAAIRLERGEITDWRVPNRGFIGGESLQEIINTLVDQRPIEALDTVFAVVATDLRTGKRATFTHGNTGLAVRASSSVPGIVQPVSINGQEYVDGGLVSQVPVQAARDLGADIVIAVDVTKLPDPDAPLDSTIAVMHQAMLIVSKVQADADTAKADFVIKPDVNQVSLADFDLRTYAIAQGELAADRAAPQIELLIARKTAELRSRSAAP